MATLRKTSKKKAPAVKPVAKKRAAPAAPRKTARPAEARSVAPVDRATNGKTAPATLNLNQKENLDKERLQVESELSSLRAELQEAPELTGDEVDLNVYEREKTLGLVAAYERRLQEINAAMKAAARGKYGICERCGKTIDPERLKIFPEARLCVNCKNELEKEQRRLRG